MFLHRLYISKESIPFYNCLLPDLHSGATGSTWRTSRATQALNSSLRPESWRRSGWISLKWPCKYKEAWTPQSWQFVSRAGDRWSCCVLLCACVYVLCLFVFVCTWCYSEAERGVDSLVCTVWSGLSCSQTHTADKSTLTHKHRLMCLSLKGLSISMMHSLALYSFNHLKVSVICN